MLLGKAIAANQKDKDSFGEAEVGIAREFEGISHIRVCDERMNNSVIPYTYITYWWVKVEHNTEDIGVEYMDIHCDSMHLIG